MELIAPYYPSGKRGRPPRGIETMLRMVLMQIWFNLSDVGIEDAIYDSYAVRKFMGIDFLSEQVPDSTTLLHFRHLLEENGIGQQMDVAARLDAAGLMMHGGSIVAIKSAPSSTKNREKKRDPEMHQTKKGNQWYFGMKIHAGVDAGSGYVHKITATSANVQDIEETAKLIRPDDEVVYGDAGYSEITKRKEIVEDERLRRVKFRINLRPSSLKMSSTYRGINWDKRIESRKSSTRSKVENAFLIVKRQFGYSKVVYRGKI